MGCYGVWGLWGQVLWGLCAMVSMGTGHSIGAAAPTSGLGVGDEHQPHTQPTLTGVRAWGWDWGWGGWVGGSHSCWGASASRVAPCVPTAERPLRGADTDSAPGDPRGDMERLKRWLWGGRAEELSGVQGVVRSTAGFALGMGLAALYGALVLLVQRSNAWFCWLSSAVLGAVLGLGMAFSIKVRLSVLLTLPHVFTSEEV